MEYDGYVAGLVSSFLSGKDINKSLVLRNAKLAQSIYSIPDDLVELRLLKHYYKKLDEMLNILILLA